MRFILSGYIANQDSSHLTPRIADEQDRPVAYVLQPEHAKLLAAAPELLSALSEALDLIDALWQNQGDTVRKCRAAIKSAT